MSWNDTKIANDDFLSADWNDMVTDQKSRLKATTGAGIPTSTPEAIGSIYYDTTNSKFYLAAGTSSSADWKKVITT